MYPPARQSATLEQVAALRVELTDFFATSSYTIDQPQVGYIRFQGQFLSPIDECFEGLRAGFEDHGFTPWIRKDQGEIVLIAMPTVFSPQPSNYWINAILLVATIVSTLLVAALSEIASEMAVGASLADIYGRGLANLWLGAPYGLGIMLILGAHELGHYFAARHHKVPVTLPYFFPFPLPPIGTMGAFIRIKAPVKNKRALFDVGAAGPLAGLVFAIPILLIGLATSSVETLPASGYTLEGNSIFYWLAKYLVKGQPLPGGGQDIFLNQLAWAGWVGLLVTGLNLIPVGQLDGGHVIYTLLGARARRFFWPVILGLVVLVFITQTAMWVIWILLLFFFGRYHAEPLDSVTPLDSRRKILAVITLLIFVLVFVPVPLRAIG